MQLVEAYVVGMDPGMQGVQGCPSPGMAERGEGNGGCGSTGLPPVPGTPSQQSRQSAVGSQGSGMDGQTPEGNVPPGFQKHNAPAAATATASKCVTECAGICEHDKLECRWSRLSAGMSETCP